MRLALRVAPRAAREIREAAAWWALHRTDASGLLRAELRNAFDLITTEPGVGLRIRDAELPDVRRVHLYHIHYYLYYRVCEECVDVLAFWHTSRGKAPRL